MWQRFFMSALLMSAILAVAPSAAVAGQGILQITEGTSSSRWGSSIASVGDVDGDSAADLIVGAPGDSIASVISVKLGVTLYTVIGASPQDAFGSAVAGLSDIDRDGINDFAVGAPHSDLGAADGGSVSVYSGRDGSPLYTLSGQHSGAHFGAAVANAGDVNGDGIADLIVGSPDDDVNGQADSGFAAVYSGADHSLLFSTGGVFDFADHGGFAVATAGDFDGDGYPDVLVGARDDDDAYLDAGSTSILSGRTGQFLHVVYGSGGDRLGTSVSTAGDANADGFDDIALGSPFDNEEPNIARTGSVRVFLGPTKQLYLTWHGTLWQEQFGSSVTSLGDVDGDGIPDLAAGAVSNTVPREGTVRILSVKTQHELETFHGQPGANGFGAALAALPDLTGDGIPELAVGEPDAGGGSKSGRVTVFAPIRDATLLQVTSSFYGWHVTDMGDVDGDAVPDFATSGGYPHRVTVISGRDGHEIFHVNADPASNGFGWSLASADLNGDGVPDVMVGDPSHDAAGSGAVQAFSGANASLLWQQVIVKNTGLGTDLDAAGDMNEDGFPDAIVGEPYPTYPEPGKAHVYSGLDGSELRTLVGATVSDSFGLSVSTAGDVDRDGAADVIIGAPWEYSAGSFGGSATVFSGSSGAKLFNFKGGKDEFLGLAVSGGQDIDADGIPDLIVTRSTVSVLVLSGRDGRMALEIDADPRGYTVSDVHAAGDLDRDGHADIVASAASHDQRYAREPLVVAWSGKTGAPLWIWRSSTNATWIAVAVSSFGDLDGDGAPDVLVGHSQNSGPQNNHVGVHAIPQRWADFGNYGSGWPGTSRIPELTLAANPFLCSMNQLKVGNSLGTTTPAWLVVGLARATLPTSYGGTLFVLPTIMLPITIPGAGLVVPFDVPCSDAIGGLPIYMQALERDPGASRGLSFTPGLEVVLTK